MCSVSTRGAHWPQSTHQPFQQRETQKRLQIAKFLRPKEEKEDQRVVFSPPFFQGHWPPKEPVQLGHEDPGLRLAVAPPKSAREAGSSYSGPCLGSAAFGRSAQDGPDDLSIPRLPGTRKLIRPGRAQSAPFLTTGHSFARSGHSINTCSMTSRLNWDPNTLVSCKRPGAT